MLMLCSSGLLYFCAPTMDAREAECARVQGETGAAFIHPYNDPRVMAGERGFSSLRRMGTMFMDQ